MPSTPGLRHWRPAFQRNGLVMALRHGGWRIAGVFLLALLLQRHAVLFGAQSMVPGHGFYDVDPPMA